MNKWKIVDKYKNQGFFRNSDYTYLVENIVTGERREMDIDNGNFIPRDTIECVNPGAYCPDPKKV